MDSSPSLTHVSLLSRIRDPERREDGWSEFVDRYGKRIYDWCIWRRLQPSDAEDVVQVVLLKLAKALTDFEYDSKMTFRGWLRTVTENAIKDFLRNTSKLRMLRNDLDIVSDVSARAELLESLNEAFDLELLDEAMSRVSSRIGQNRWMAWQLMACEGESGAEVARRLQMKVATVYTARNQVQQMISAEVQLLEGRQVEGQ